MNQIRNINKTLVEFFRKKNPLGNTAINDKIIIFLESPVDEKPKLAQELIKNLLGLHQKEYLGEHISELYRIECKTMHLTGNRDHVIHALNTFLLGLYLNENFLTEKVNIFQWEISALLHDIAYPLEISESLDNKPDLCDEIKERYVRVSKEIEDANGKENSIDVAGGTKNFERLKPCIVCKRTHTPFSLIKNETTKWSLNNFAIRKHYDNMREKPCHGILSSLTVLYLIDSMYQKHNPHRDNGRDRNGWKQENFENHVVPACAAIYLHNLKPADFFQQLDKDYAPLPYLLKLCDELQSWDRLSEKNPSSNFPENYDIQIDANGRLIFKVALEDVRKKIESNLDCLKDSDRDIKVELKSI